ncbi:MAG: hypothetical protein P9F19_07450 [Candidatus Contendobacter sp.]|nr:hypothetical protein [Candidatus Contendobacter sp.]MDG4557206.1 hypothetical protein [Candidatus Contendobacter sp.]
MKSATRTPGSLPDNPVPLQSAPDGFSLRGWLNRLVLRLGAAASAPPETAAMQPATHPPIPAPPAPRAPQEPEPDDAPAGFNLLGWLRHFAIYLCAVAMVCLIGLYFLWQIPFLRDPSQLLGIVDDSRPPRLPTTGSTPLARPAQTAPSPPPVNTAPTQSTVSTGVAVATTAPPLAPTEPAGVQPPVEPSPTTTPDGQAEPAPTEPTVEVVQPPPTPQAEIEQLLADAQQQMDNRRFTAPTSGNALSTYQRVLALQPNHPAALEGIQRITTYYRDVAQQSLQQGRLDESLAYINRGLRATPQSDTLLSLRRQVQQTAAQRAREEQRKQAALEEMQRQQFERVRQEQLRRQQEQPQPWWRQPSNYNDGSGFNQR